MIPKKIHFIWIGSKLPDKYACNIQRFIENHHDQGFDIFLWTEHACESIDGCKINDMGSLDFFNLSLFEKEENIGAKSDILRYEIIYCMGGIYNDVDAISLKPFDYTLLTKEFVSHTFHPWNNITNAVFGFKPNSLFLKYVLSKLPLAQEEETVDRRTGPRFFTNCLLEYYGGSKMSWSDFCSAKHDFAMVHQDRLVYPRLSSSKSRNLDYSYHLNDGNWFIKENKRTTPKLSLCTAIKNRLFFLKQTLPQNIADSPLDEVEFVVLDYSSDDGLSDWIRPFVLNGRANYFRADGQDFWRNSHAKNVSSLVATGDIVCNVDADNFVGVGFANFVIQHFKKNSGILTGPPGVDGVTGRIAMRKSNFIDLGGYNEQFRFGWGCEDIDLVSRVKHTGGNVSFIDSKYLLHISHSDDLRGKHGEVENFRRSQKISHDIMDENIKKKIFVANRGLLWGSCLLTKNYDEKIKVGLTDKGFIKMV